MYELVIPVAGELESLLESVPDTPGVYLLWPRAGKPHLARTKFLRRRLKRVLSTLGDTIERVEYQVTGSRLEAHFVLWELARQHLGAGYREAIRLRLPAWVKLILTNAYPRTTVTCQLGRAPAVYYGPFRNRSTAARFESAFLDLFQLRRCPEDLSPSPQHPGCIYGEMGRCVRPCQEAVGQAEYQSEVHRVAEFLRTGGRSLAVPAEAARERLSAEMDFEGAALMHRQCTRIGETVALRDEMAAELEHLHAVAVVPSAEKNTVNLGWLRAGNWKGFSAIEFQIAAEKPFSLDARLREMAEAVDATPAVTTRERMEQLAVVARWRYSGWCDGELLMVDDWGKIPFRRLVNAVARIAHAQGTGQKQS
jgi:excinuclease UvrABC nuclease subunit